MKLISLTWVLCGRDVGWNVIPSCVIALEMMSVVANENNIFIACDHYSADNVCRRIRLQLPCDAGSKQLCLVATDSHVYKIICNRDIATFRTATLHIATVNPGHLILRHFIPPTNNFGKVSYRDM